MYQQTIATRIDIEGTGLHSGKLIKMKICEGPPDSGIVFKRVDIEGHNEIKAHAKNVVNVDRCTTVGRDGIKISTIEHFMAAAYGLGIDNLLIEIDGEELPALDGSADVFCKRLKAGGIKSCGKERYFLTIRTPLFVENKYAKIIALPGKGLRLTCIIDYSHPVVQGQVFEISLENDSFEEVIAPARTYGFWEEVSDLWERNLALGGNLDNALVIKKDGYTSQLRFHNELVRHKCLDLLGDLALIGKRMNAHFISLRGGHSLNFEMVKSLESMEVN